MGSEPARMWRPPDLDRVLMMSGQTTSYAVDPRDEYVIGVVDTAPMASRRGRERRTVAPGELVAWDPSGPHSGTAVEGRAWTARLVVIEAVDLAALVADPGDDDAPLPADIAFPDPRVDDPVLVDGFRRMHAALSAPSSRLAREELVGQWLRALIRRAGSGRWPTTRPRRRNDRAVRAALDHLAGNSGRNVGLDELAAVAGVGRFQLIDAFRAGTGLAPHTFQIAFRVRASRRLIERGVSISDAAVATGFADQSHLHRHFHGSLGMTPGDYRRRFCPQPDRRRDEERVERADDARSGTMRA